MAHGHDMISIHMVKLWGDSTYKALEVIFKDFINKKIFPAEWKKANLVPVCKGIINVQKTTNQFFFFQCLAKNLNDSFIRLCFKHF